MRRTWSLIVAAFAFVTLAVAAETAKATLRIEGMTCGGCVPAVNVQLKKTEGVLAYEVCFEKGEAVVSYDPAKTTPLKIAESVGRTGYTASVKGQGVAAAAVGSPLTAVGKAPHWASCGRSRRRTLTPSPSSRPSSSTRACR